jgi:hypothetical protein
MLLMPTLLFSLLLGTQQLFCQRIVLARLRGLLVVGMVGVVAIVLVDVRVQVELFGLLVLLLRRAVLARRRRRRSPLR